MSYEGQPLPCGHMKRCGVQYQGTNEDWDGVSEWLCEECGRRFGRWSKHELAANEIEGRYGRCIVVVRAAQKDGTP